MSKAGDTDWFCQWCYDQGMRMPGGTDKPWSHLKGCPSSPTGRTEAYILNPHPPCVPADFAKELERETVKLKADVEAWKLAANSLFLHARHDSKCSELDCNCGLQLALDGFAKLNRSEA